MWPFRVQTEESRHKLDVSVITMKNEEGGWVSTQFRESEKVRVRLTSSRAKWPTWLFTAHTKESSHKLDAFVNL